MIKYIATSTQLQGSLHAKGMPLDGSSIVTDVADLATLITEGYVYKGMKVYVEAEDKTYRYNGTAFVLDVDDGAIAAAAVEASTAAFQTMINSMSEYIVTEDFVVGELIRVASITVNGNSPSVGNTSQLTAAILPSNATNKSVAWSSSNNGIATVNSSGIVTGIAAGDVTITCTASDGSGVNDSIQLTVYVQVVEVTGVVISGSTAGVVGGAIQLTAAITPSNATDKTVAWSSSNESVATVNSSGLVTLLSEGNVTITATSNDISDTHSIEATVSSVAVTGISVTGDASGDTGTTIQLAASVTPTNATNKAVSWSSSNESVATVDEDGLVTLIAAGSATITATSVSNGTITGTKYITANAVNVAVTGITVTGTVPVIGSSSQLTAAILPTNATNKGVTWSSSDSNIISVTATGLITAVAAGNATITATASDGSGIYGAIQLTVEAVSTWNLPSDWYDIESILAADTEEYPYKAILLYSDAGGVTSSALGKWDAAMIKTSDGATYTAAATHTWNVASNRACSEGYNTRYVIYYFTTQYTGTWGMLKDNLLYVVSDGLRYKSNLQDCLILRAAKFKNGAGVYGTGTIGKNFFFHCPLLKYVSSFFNENSLTAEGMFQSCAALLEVGSFSLANAASVKYLYKGVGTTTSKGVKFPAIYAPVATAATAMFEGSYIDNVPSVDIPIATDISNMFKQAKCVLIDSINIPSATTVLYWMVSDGTPTLTTINSFSGLKVSADISSQTSLSTASLVTILSGLVDLTGNAAQALTIGATNLAKLSTEQKAIATNKNWTLA